MATSTATSVLTDAVRARARAEAAETVAMLGYRDDEMARTAHVEPPMRRLVERSAIALTIGEAMGLSEGQAQHRLSIADTLRDQSPATWEAFLDGQIDLSRAREVAHTIKQLKRSDSVHLLDQKVLKYAAGHTTAELRGWLRRFVLRVEADLAVERAEDERTNRHVSIKHGDDSMSALYAYLPSHQAAAIEARLRKEARRATPNNHAGADDDDRTVAQREADLLVDWCTDSDAAAAAIDANIAVTIDAEVLAGAVAGFAESADRRWAVPASWIAEVVKTGSTFWHRIVTQPVTGDVLSHEYAGRFCPDTLNIALQFLHGVCQAPGCVVPANRCDIDHRIPFPEGPTSADNLGPFCRRHHSYKGHGLLHWSTSPARPPTPHIVIEMFNEPILMQYAA